MPTTLEGSCRCGAVSFTVETHTPVPYQRCYCTICRKTAGGGGYAINLGADRRTLEVQDPQGAIGVYRAEIERDGTCELSTGERSFCSRCATALWLYDPQWPELVHPFASAVDSDLPTPPQRVHLLLAFKAGWVEPQVKEGDACFDGYPDQSIEAWHRAHGLWVE